MSSAHACLRIAHVHRDEVAAELAYRSSSATRVAVPLRYTRSVTHEREAARAQRADERRRSAMLLEPIASLDESIALHDTDSLEERWAAMARLCRSAWLATGQPFPSSARPNLPGEVFRIPHADTRRTT